MKTWQEDLLIGADEVPCEWAVFRKIESAVQVLGFAHCAFGLQMTQAVGSSKTTMLNYYAAPWWLRYLQQDFDQIEFASPALTRFTRLLEKEAQHDGLRVGWVASNMEVLGKAGLWTLSYAHKTLSAAERASQEADLRELAALAHVNLYRIFFIKQKQQIALTAREIEVLRWSAEGKTSAEIANILSVSESTVNFHIKNAVAKLQSKNKIAAVVRAVGLGLLS